MKCVSTTHHVLPRLAAFLDSINHPAVLLPLLWSGATHTAAGHGSGGGGAASSAAVYSAALAGLEDEFEEYNTITYAHGDGSYY